MKRTTPLQILLAIVLVIGVLLACKKKEEASTSSAAPSSADSTGVPECDEYLNKYEACVKEKVPAVARPQIEQSIKTMRESYKQAAANPASKASLAQTCKQTLEATKSAMAPHGCTW
jgi:hypothetical protein